MSKQYNKAQKRQRRQRFIKRRKALTRSKTAEATAKEEAKVEPTA
jgi:hypothetical protein